MIDKDLPDETDQAQVHRSGLIDGTRVDLDHF
jgi:hypothetical protein